MGKSCWILYDREDLKINTFFAGRLRDVGNALGLECEIVTSDSVDPYCAPDIVVARNRNPDMSVMLEDMGSVVYNRSSVSRVCNDKSATYRLASSLGIPYLPYSESAKDLPPGPHGL